MTTSSFRLDGIQADSFAEPQSVDELAAGLRECNGNRQPAFVYGNGSRVRFGNAGPAYAQALSTRRLNNVVAYSPEDLVVAVEPGVTIAELRRVLGEDGLHLAIDVADPGVETIGGVFASGLSGPRRLQYGALKDSTLGIEVVQPDGTVVKAGGMVVKNVTGFDLARLHYGAHGAFGAIARLNFKVLPAPERVSEVTAAFATIDKAHAAAAAVLQSSLDLTAVYVTWDEDRDEGEAWQAHIWVSGSDSAVATLIERVEEMVASGARPAGISHSDAVGGDLESFKPFIDLRSDFAVGRLSVPASKQVEVARRLAGAGNQSICADLGSGLIYARAHPTMEWREATRRIDGRTVFLSLPVELRNGIDVFGGVDPLQEELLRRLKQEYDPDGTLNRGRFVLGL